MKKLINTLVVGNEKALVGFIVPGLLGLLLLGGVTGDMTVEEALTTLVTALLTAAGVWSKANTK